MHKYLILSLLITLLVFTTSANQYVTIGTNTFGFAFEDTSLTTNMQARIVEDWKILTAPWTNITVSINSDSGKLDFNNIELAYYSKKDYVDYRQYVLNKSNDKFYIIFSEELIKRYKMAFDFYDSHINEYSKISELISTLNSDALVNMPSNQVHNIFYYPERPVEVIAFSAPDIKRSLSSRTYYMPSVLFFSEMPVDLSEKGTNVLWAFIPMRSFQYQSTKGKMLFDTAVYTDERWKIRPLPIF